MQFKDLILFNQFWNDLKSFHPNPILQLHSFDIISLFLILIVKQNPNMSFKISLLKLITLLEVMFDDTKISIVDK